MDPNKPKANASLPFGLKTEEAVVARKRYMNEKKARAQKAFKTWANAHRRVKTVKNQEKANSLEAAFWSADPKRAAATLKKVKTEHPTVIETERLRNAKERQDIKIALRNLRVQKGRSGLPPFSRLVNLSRRRHMEIAQGGIAGPKFNLPPLPPRPSLSLSSQQRNSIRNKGILGARLGGTRKRGKDKL
jgi:hypothetical protein